MFVLERPLSSACIGFPLKAFIVEFTYRRPFSSVEKLMNLQEGGFGLIFVTNSSMSALLGP